MVVGFDFCFSYPEWFVRGELGLHAAPAFWKLVSETHAVIDPTAPLSRRLYTLSSCQQILDPKN